MVDLSKINRVYESATYAFKQAGLQAFVFLWAYLTAICWIAVQGAGSAA
jgi:hypothetical protein